MAKIAVDSDRASRRGEASVPLTARMLAAGNGWMVHDVVCTAGPGDRAFEERHERTAIAVVVSGTFQYRTSTGSELMTPGSILLGNPGDGFTCGHDHGAGDRCVSFSFTPEFRERLAADVALGPARFSVPRLPPLRALSPLFANASALLIGADTETIEETAFSVLGESIRAERGLRPRAVSAEPSSIARVTRVARMIECDLECPHDLSALAAIARLSPYHFLRTFEAVTGATPHQYVLRARLRRAAVRLRTETAKIVDIAFDCGFGDVSNFNRAFRAEFGTSPRAYRSTRTRIGLQSYFPSI